MRERVTETMTNEHGETMRIRRPADWRADADGLNEMRERLDRYVADKALLGLPVTVAEVRALVDDVERLNAEVKRLYDALDVIACAGPSTKNPVVQIDGENFEPAEYAEMVFYGVEPEASDG